MMLTFLGWLAGVYLGHRSNVFDLGTFEATRPLTDGQLAAAVLRNVARSVWLSLAVWVGCWQSP